MMSVCLELLWVRLTPNPYEPDSVKGWGQTCE